MILSVYIILGFLKYIISTNTIQDEVEIFLDNNFVLDKSDRVYKLFMNLSNTTCIGNFNRCINNPVFKKEAWNIVYTSTKEKCTRYLNCSQLLDILSLIDFLGVTDDEECILEREIFYRNIGSLILDNIIKKNLIFNNLDILSLSNFTNLLKNLFKRIINCIDNNMIIYLDKNIYDIEYENKEIKFVKFIHYLKKELKCNEITSLVICWFGKALNLSKIFIIDIFNNLEIILFDKVNFEFLTNDMKNFTYLIPPILIKFEIEWLYIIGLKIKQEDIDKIVRWQKNLKFINFDSFSCIDDTNNNNIDYKYENQYKNNNIDYNQIKSNIDDTNNNNIDYKYENQYKNNNIDYNQIKSNNIDYKDNINNLFTKLDLSNLFKINSIKSIILKNIKLDSFDFFTLSNNSNIIDISLKKCYLYSSKENNLNILDKNEDFLKYIKIDFYDSFPKFLEYFKIEDCIINDEFIKFYRKLNIKNLIIKKTNKDDNISNLDIFVTKLIDLITINILHISGFNISKENIKKISNINSLRILKLIDCNLKVNYLQEIIKLPNIYSIDLSQNIEITTRDINNLWTEIFKKKYKTFIVQ